MQNLNFNESCSFVQYQPSITVCEEKPWLPPVQLLLPGLFLHHLHRESFCAAPADEILIMAGTQHTWHVFDPSLGCGVLFVPARGQQHESKSWKESVRKNDWTCVSIKTPIAHSIGLLVYLRIDSRRVLRAHVSRKIISSSLLQRKCVDSSVCRQINCKWVWKTRSGISWEYRGIIDSALLPNPCVRL